MMTTRGSLLAWTAVAALSAATIGSTTTEAGDFAAFKFSKYCPDSICSEIEAHLNRHSVAKQKDAAPANPVTVAGPTTTDAPAANACLTKQYLATGAVLFKDVCTKHWAINSTSVAGHRAASRNCLTKDSREHGVVMFRDICTNEWAMNTADQPAEPPQSW
jgi:hypothetical protein